MPEIHLKRFYLSIVLPSFLALGFFILLIFLVILPSLEKNIMTGKKEKISELTHTAISLLDEYHTESVSGAIADDSARVLAAGRIREIRYGEENKDYFWIINREPVMIMHPYRPELVGANLSDYLDPEGKALFVEAKKVAETSGDGFIDYMWQWKDDSTRIVPKLSYVKEFAPWGWIVGTGIYLEDVREEINLLKRRLLLITLLFALLIGVLLAIIIRQSLAIERKRAGAEQKLRVSRQKYKSLVEASREGTLLVIDGKVVFANLRMKDLSGFEPVQIRSMDISELLDTEWGTIQSKFQDPEQSITFESRLARPDGKSADVVVSASRVRYTDEEGYIFILKEVGLSDQLRKGRDLLTQELRDQLNMMHQPAKFLAAEPRYVESDVSVQEAAAVMVKKRTSVLLVRQGTRVTGFLTARDLVERVMTKDGMRDLSVMEVMSAPVHDVPDHCPVYEVMIALQRTGASCVALKDPAGQIIGLVGNEELHQLAKNSVSYLVKEIQASEDIEALKKIYTRVPSLVEAMLESGTKTRSVCKAISLISDFMLNRVIGLMLEETGPPPAPFAFMVMGSEARGEQTLATDQDNAIIYDDRKAGSADIGSYFVDLGRKVNTALNSIGYRYCRGNIMAGNPKWTVSLSAWKRQYTNWVENGSPQDILEAAIFFDFKCAYGDCELIHELREHVAKTTSGKAVFFYHLAQPVLKFKPPFKIPGSLAGDEGSKEDRLIDTKLLLLPFVSFVRIYSTREGLTENSSFDRLTKLREGNQIDRYVFEEIWHALEVLMRLRLENQIFRIRAGEEPGNMLILEDLSRSDLAAVKKVLTEISMLQSKIRFDFQSGEQG